MVGLPEDVEHRAALRGPRVRPLAGPRTGAAVKHQVQPVGRQPVGQILSALPVIDTNEGIVGGSEADAFCRQLTRQPAVTVAVELQAERCP